MLIEKNLKEAFADYRAKWYGETVEQAKKNLPEQNQVME